MAARVLTVDLAADDPAGRQPVYEQYTRTLFLFGIGGAVATGLLAGLLPDVLGAEWQSITWVLAALACVVPWRMVLGVAGTLGVVAQRSKDLLSLELVHLGLVVVAFSIAAAIGLQAFVATVAGSVVLANLAYHRLAGRMAGVRSWAPLVPLAAVTFVGLVLTASQIV